MGTTNCKRLAPAGLAATMQGCFQGAYFGLGCGVGSLVGGFLSQREGFAAMYVVHAALVCVGWVGVAGVRAWAAQGPGGDGPSSPTAWWQALAGWWQAQRGARASSSPGVGGHQGGVALARLFGTGGYKRLHPPDADA